jgi:predicted metalloprotease with PDZ domain
VLLCFGALNIAVRATSHKLEDGVLWEARPEGVTAADVAARGGAMAAGIRPGDVIIAIDGAPVETVDDLQVALARATRDDALSYTVLRLGEQQMLNVEVAPVPPAIQRSTSSARRSASSRCWSVHRFGCGAPTTPRRCISSGSAWRFSAP